jgi:hypothetical protein
MKVCSASCNVHEVHHRDWDPDLELVVEAGDSPELVRIMTHHLPQWAELFEAKNAGYQSSANDHFGPGKLGARGQYVELFRKMGKLHRALWDGEPLHGEAVDEVLMDLIGHCFLAIDALSNEPPRVVVAPADAPDGPYLGDDLR